MHRKKPGTQTNHLANRLFRDEVRRTAKDLSMKDLKEKYGINGHFVFYLKRNERGISFPHAIDLANKLGIDIGAIQEKCK